MRMGSLVLPSGQSDAFPSDDSSLAKHSVQLYQISNIKGEINSEKHLCFQLLRQTTGRADGVDLEQ